MTELPPIETTVWGDDVTSPVPTSSSSIWVMSDAVWASGLVLTALELAVSLSANTLLIATICYSPSLKTPPNIQLVS